MRLRLFTMINRSTVRIPCVAMPEDEEAQSYVSLPCRRTWQCLADLRHIRHGRSFSGGLTFGGSVSVLAFPNEGRPPDSDQVAETHGGRNESLLHYQHLSSHSVPP